jgi:hypothetical protein
VFASTARLFSRPEAVPRLPQNGRQDSKRVRDEFDRAEAAISKPTRTNPPVHQLGMEVAVCHFFTP